MSNSTRTEFEACQSSQSSHNSQRRKVKSAKTTLAMTAPKTIDHLSVQLKNIKLKSDLATQIQMENNRLKEKIAHIMRTSVSMEYRNVYERKSLNQQRRQQELLRITRENEAIQLRLNQCKPHYNVKSWEEDWLKTLKTMARIARYPRGDINNQMNKKKKKNRKGSSECKEQKTDAEATQHKRASIKTLNRANPMGKKQIGRDKEASRTCNVQSENYTE